VSPTPTSNINADEANGSQRVMMRSSPRKRDMNRRAYTISMPTATSTTANPVLNAQINSKPKPIRCIDTALKSTTNAAGHGMIPPLMPSTNSCFTDTF